MIRGERKEQLVAPLTVVEWSFCECVLDRSHPFNSASLPWSLRYVLLLQDTYPAFDTCYSEFFKIVYSHAT